jgi:hypothetical protein
MSIFTKPVEFNFPLVIKAEYLEDLAASIGAFIDPALSDDDNREKLLLAIQEAGVDALVKVGANAITDQLTHDAVIAKQEIEEGLTSSRAGIMQTMKSAIAATHKEASP